MLRIILALLFSVCCCSIFGQITLEAEKLKASFYSQKISADSIRSYLSQLASTDFEGRETGTEGLDEAADYISFKFQQWGLYPAGENGTFFQSVPFETVEWDEISLSINGESYEAGKDFFSLPQLNQNREPLENEELYFLGYGIDDSLYSDYKKADVKGKTILVLEGEPLREDSIYHLSGTRTKSSWSTDWQKKMMVAHEKGVRLVLYVPRDFKNMLSSNRRQLTGNNLQLWSSEEDKPANHLIINYTMLKEILGEKSKKFIKAREQRKKGKVKKPLCIKSKLEVLQGLTRKKVYSRNILVSTQPQQKEWEASDPSQIILSAHYDHLGKKGSNIFFGADDNASGTSTILEIMRVLSTVDEVDLPERGITAILFCGEEKGLLGSKYYSANPIIPRENTMVDINIDMVGRTDEIHKGNPWYLYIIGADRISQQLHDINSTVNNTYVNLELDYKFNADDDPNRFYYRSDHYNFARQGIPSVFFFSGVHKDYHQPGDTPDKIIYDRVAKVTSLGFHLAWELAHRKNRLVINGH